jgi:3-hydroxybutyrate dehydrogenase
VLTPLVEKQIEDLAARKGISKEAASDELLAAKQPSRRFVTPEQIGELALFLCSEAASQVTGASLTMDGGWTAQ